MPEQTNRLVGRVRPFAACPGWRALMASISMAACALTGCVGPQTGKTEDAGANSFAGMSTLAGEWPVYGGDAGSRKFSPLDQINIKTIENLEIAWVWTSPDDLQSVTGPTARPGILTDNFKATPIMVGGRLYVRSQLGAVEALDPATGRTLWRHTPSGYLAGTPKSYGFTTRGVAFWKGASGAGRILSTTPDRKLIALDAATGASVESFGKDGVVDLDATLRRLGDDPSYLNYGNQVPVIVGDVVVIGSVVTDNEIAYLPSDKRKRPNIPSGDVRGFDVRTGQLRWTFHTVPVEGEYGVETWENESWRWVGSTNVWSLMSADLALGYIYLPVTGPTFNYYGGFRKGDNLFADSIVCLDARTGKRVWHFQTVHHPVFDYDMPAAPVLADIVVDGRNISAVIAMNKTGYLYVLDRATGEPVWPIVERPVPATTIAGERTSPTQPIPTAPPSIAIQGMDTSKANRLTPGLAAKTQALLDRYDHGDIFTPVSERGTILSPGISGGVNWPGGAFDPLTGRFFVTAINQPTIRSLEKADNHYGYAYKQLGDGLGGFSLAAPPWGTLTSVDMNEGDFDWQVANGPGPRRHPDLKALNLPELGSPSKSNPVVTRSLVFAAHSGRFSFEDKPAAGDMRIAADIPDDLVAALDLENGAALRAYDKTSGKVVWSHPIGPSFNDGGAPMTYMWRGRQFVVTPVGGGAGPSYLIAFALPADGVRNDRPS